MVDLHIHSSYSDDGEFSPSELVSQCKARQISLMSITDHNCIRSSMEAIAAAQKSNITYIPGIEIDCIYKNTNFHILAYGIDFESNDFQEIKKNIEKQIFRASLEMLEKTQILGFHITEKDMWEASQNNYHKDAWTGELFAEVLLKKPEFIDHPFLLPYRLGGSRSDNPYVNFYWDFYAPGKLCYATIAYPEMTKIIDIIHQNHGIAILAHPGVNLKGCKSLLPELLTLNLDGLEAFSSYHTPAQAAYYSTLADEHGLLATCGSDYHGKIKPSIPLGGAVFASDMEPEQTVTKIEEKLLTYLYRSGFGKNKG